MDAIQDMPSIRPIHWEELDALPAAVPTGIVKPLLQETLSLQIELGRTHIERSETQSLRTGSVIPLDDLAGDPVDLYAGSRLIGRGEVLELGGTLAVRVVQLAAGRPT
jgi:flagellar motor switch protein FliN/FliY